jgi:GTP-binding protein Era
LTEVTENSGEIGGETTCGFVALIGAPNAGKSTLLNQLVGTKIAIVTPKVQTTRTRMLGIRVVDGAQVIFVDTPGIFKPRCRLDRAMVSAAWAGASDADLVVVLMDAARGIDGDTRRIFDGLKEAGRKAILVLNKIDLVKKEKLLALAAEVNTLADITETFMVSALDGSGVDDLLKFLAKNLPKGHWLYPEDQLTDAPMRQMAAEITREKIFLELHQELPYASTVETESWEEKKDGSVKISQVIYIQRDSQKSIVIGKGGQMLKLIGQKARHEMEEVFGHKVHLFLFVKVREGWVDDPERYREIGLDYVK